MLAGLDQETFDQWRAFDAYICPIGPERLDAVLASVCAAALRYLGAAVRENPEVLRGITPRSIIRWIRDQSADEVMTDQQIDDQLRAAIDLARANLG